MTPKQLRMRLRTHYPLAYLVLDGLKQPQMKSWWAVRCLDAMRRLRGIPSVWG